MRIFLPHSFWTAVVTALAVFLTVAGRAAAQPALETEALLGPCLSDTRATCAQTAEAFVAKGSINKADRLNELIRAVNKDTCAGRLDPQEAYQILIRASLPINVGSTLDAIERYSGACPLATQVAIGVVEWLPATKNRSMILALMLRSQPNCDDACQAKADRLFDPTQLRFIEDLAAYARRISSRVSPIDPRYAETKAQLERALRRAPREDRLPLQRALIPFYVSLGDDTALVKTLKSFPGQSQREGAFSDGLASALSIFGQIADDRANERALAVIDAFPRASKADIFRAQVFARMDSCQASCAQAAISAISNEIGEQADATVALIKLALKFEDVPADLFDTAIFASQQQQDELRRKIERTSRISAVAADETLRIVELKETLARLAADTASLILKDPKGCETACLRRAVDQLQPMVGEDLYATLRLSEIVIDDYPARQNLANLASDGLIQVRDRAETEADRGKAVLALTRLQLRSPQGCSPTCQQQALAALSPFLGTEIETTFRFAEVVLSDRTSFARQSAIALRGLETLSLGLLSPAQAGLRAGLLAQLSLQHPAGCSQSCQAASFDLLKQHAGLDVGASRRFAKIVLGSVFDFEAQIPDAIASLRALDPRLLSQSSRAELALLETRLVLTRPSGCDQRCQRTVFGRLQRWIGEDYQLTLKFAGIVAEDPVARVDLLDAALSGLDRLPRESLQPSQVGSIALARARLQLAAPSGCNRSCQAGVVEDLGPLLGQNYRLTEGFAELVLSDFIQRKALSGPAIAALNTQLAETQNTSRTVRQSTLIFRLRTADPYRCFIPCLAGAEPQIRTYLGKHLGPTQAYADVILARSEKLTPPAEALVLQQRAIAHLRSLNPNTLTFAQRGSVALRLSDLQLANPEGCDQACEQAALRVLVGDLGQEKDATLGFAGRVLEAIQSGNRLQSNDFEIGKRVGVADLILAPRSRQTVELGSLTTLNLDTRHDLAIAGLAQLNTALLTFSERARHARLQAQLSLRQPESCDEGCRAALIAQWQSYVGRDAEASLAFAEVVVRDIREIERQRAQLLNELQVLNWDFDNPAAIRADLEEVLERELGEPWPQADAFLSQALFGLEAIELSRLKFYNQARVLLARLSLLAAQPDACGDACLDRNFAELQLFLDRDLETTALIIERLLRSERLSARYGKSVSSSLAALVSNRDALDPQRRRSLLGLRFTARSACASDCRLDALEDLQRAAGSDFETTRLFVEMATKHAPLLKADAARAAAEVVSLLPLSVDDQIALSTAVDELEDARSCSLICSLDKLDRWQALANQSGAATLKYASEIAGRLDLPQKHAEAAYALLEQVDLQNSSLDEKQRRSVLSLKASLGWQLGKPLERNPLEDILDTIDLPLTTAPVGEPSDVPVAVQIEPTLSGCGVEVILAAITPPALFDAGMPSIDQLPKRCKIAALQAMLSAFGEQISIDGIFGPVSARKTREALENSDRNISARASFEDWMLLDLMRQRPEVIVDAATILRGL